jgi:hypothetical protein
LQWADHRARLYDPITIRSNAHTEEIVHGLDLYVAHTGGDLTHEGSKLVEAWLSARNEVAARDRLVTSRPM